MNIVASSQMLEITLTLEDAPELKMAQREMPQSILLVNPDTATLRFEDGVFRYVILEKRAPGWRMVKVFHDHDKTMPDWVRGLVTSQAAAGALR